MTTETPFVIETMDISETRRVVNACVDYWGCMNPECNGDTELHQRIWADRP